MGERKVLNKYYPADFDPAKIPRGKRPKNGQCVVRMMLPFSVQCDICGEYMYVYARAPPGRDFCVFVCVCVCVLRVPMCTASCMGGYVCRVRAREYG
jgi:hypothetical protein